MSAVVEAVVNVVSSVVDVVGDAVKAVGQAVTFVADKVADTVRAVAADPLPTLLSIAGQMVGIPAPLTMAAITAARGGDLEDIILSAGTAYLAPQIGSAISSTVSSSFIDAGLNENFSQVASDSIGKGLVNGTVAEIKGGSFDDGFAGGFTGGLVSGGVSEVSSYVKPEIIQMAQDSGLDLKDANAVFNATKRALSAGITSEITGKNDFATAFTSSAIGSGVDSGVNSLNKTIDQQFKTAATDWDKRDKESSPIEIAITGAGIPNSLVNEVQVSDIGFANSAPEEQPAEVKKPNVDLTPNTVLKKAPEVEDANISLDSAPKAEDVSKFSDLVDLSQPQEDVLGEKIPEDLTEVGIEPQPQEVTDLTPKGGLAAVSDVLDLSKIGEEPVAASATPVISEAPIGQSLTATGLAPEAGGLNAMAVKPPEEKMAESQGLKATDITKPVVATVGNILKSTLMQKKALPQRPVRGLPAARPVSRPPPQKMDVAKLIPIQRAASLPPTKRAAPAQRLDSTAKLTPIQNIAGLTSMVKRTG